jgi:hypothetical protein
VATQPQQPGPAGPSSAEEWSARAADAVESVVETVHDKVVRPAVLAGRAVVFGVLIAVVGIVVLTLLAVGLVRLLDVYAFGGRVWASDALIGALACGGGFVLWGLRNRRRHAPEP